MRTTKSDAAAIAPVVLLFIIAGMPVAIRSVPSSENVLWLLVFLIPALVVLAIHVLLLALWRRVSTRRVRRHVGSALVSGDAQSLRRAAAATERAAGDWPGRDLWELGKAIQITRHRMQRPR